VLIIYGAYINGLFGALITFLEVFFASVVTMLAFEYVSDAAIKVYFRAASDYANAISFFLIFSLVLGAFHIVARVYFSPELSFNKAFNVIGSLIFGFLIWILVGGVLATGFLMLPLEDDAFYKYGNPIFLDVDKKFVANFDKFARQIGGARKKFSIDEFSSRNISEKRKPKTIEERPESKEKTPGPAGSRTKPEPPGEKPAENNQPGVPETPR